MDRDTKMFMNWTVPRRLTADKDADRPTLPRLENTTPRCAASATPRLASALPAVEVTPRKINSARANYTSASRHSAREPPQTRHSARELTPQMRLGIREPTPQTRHSARELPQTRHSAREPTPQMRHGMREPTPQTRHSAREPTPQNRKPGTAASFRAEAPLSSYLRKTKAYRTEMVLNGFEPDRHGPTKDVEGAKVQNAIDDWMKTATEKDRVAALTFFQSLSGARLLGGMSTPEQQRIQQVIRSIQRDRITGKDQPEADQGNLRYIRLLTPGTRANKWMHQTWHHLPTLKDDDPVMNNSSIYMRPQRNIPRHFLLHPDWV